jgi:hypothetical protein
MSPPPPKTPNRRRGRRQLPKGATKTQCYPNALGLGQNIALAVLDLSETGVRLLVKQKLTPGREVEIGLEGVGHRRPVKILGRVAWTVKTSDGNHCVGVEFQRTLPYADFLQLARL